MTSREQLAWAAGVFVGEGSTSIHRPHNYVGVRVTIGQAGVDNEPPELLLRFQKIIGFGRLYRTAKAGHRMPQYKAQWQYVARNFEESQAAITMMWPWLTIQKREQAAEAFKVFHAYRATRKTKVVQCHRKAPASTDTWR